MIDEDLDTQAHSFCAKEAAACACLEPSIRWSTAGGVKTHL